MWPDVVKTSLIQGSNTWFIDKLKEVTFDEIMLSSKQPPRY